MLKNISQEIFFDISIKKCECAKKSKGKVSRETKIKCG